MSTLQWEQGQIKNPETGEIKPVVVCGSPLNRRDKLISGLCIGYGVLAIGVGVCYMVTRAFVRGSYSYELGEYKALNDLGLINGQTSTTYNCKPIDRKQDI